MSLSDDRSNILLVDDSPEKLLALETVLESLGQNLVRASSGREALRCLMSRDFAVILLDVNMPGMDGFETAKLIRQRRAFEQTPIIFVTAFADEMNAAHGYALGAVDFISQPVIPDVLRTKVGVFVDLHRKNRQVRRQAEWLERRATQLHKLTAASLAITGSASVEQTLRSLAESARSIIGADCAVASVSTDLRVEGARTVASASPEVERPPLSDEVLGQLVGPVLKLNKPRRLKGAELVDQLLVLSADGTADSRGGWMAAPLVGRDGSNIGSVQLVDLERGDFSEDDEAILVQLAQFASIAIENTVYAHENESNRIKDEFLATLSHELRTPLTAILGWTRLLRDANMIGALSHGLDVIERNARAQTKLIDDLLDVSRIRSGKLAITRQPLSLTALAAEVVDGARPAAEARGLALRFESQGDSSSVFGDPERLRQVLANLVSNALKFTPAGGTITVAVRRVGGAVQVVVSDTGQGISRGFLPFVFDRFSQGDSSSTRTHGGLGLGLTVVRHIVELHGGEVTAESAGEGLGATFTVRLPVLEVGANKREARLASPAASPSGAPLSGLSVLVVDDEVDSRDLVVTILKRAGARVRSAGSVAEALVAFEPAPDVVISDLAMPEADGFSLVEQVRRLPGPQGGRVPVIAFTAYTRDEDRQRALVAGFARHVAKPCDPSELIAAVLDVASIESDVPVAAEGNG